MASRERLPAKADGISGAVATARFRRRSFPAFPSARLEGDTKLIVSYFVGGRDGDCAKWFIDDLAARLANRVQLTTDGHKAYLEAVESAFGADIDYAMLVKLYGASPDSAKSRYSQPNVLA